MLFLMYFFCYFLIQNFISFPDFVKFYYNVCYWSVFMSLQILLVFSRLNSVITVWISLLSCSTLFFTVLLSSVWSKIASVTPFSHFQFFFDIFLLLSKPHFLFYSPVLQGILCFCIAKVLKQHFFLKISVFY